MMNRIKSYALVHKPEFIMTMIVLLVMTLGAVVGYGIGRVECDRSMSTLQDWHVHELKRMQAGHNYTIDKLTSRIASLARTIEEGTDND